MKNVAVFLVALIFSTIGGFAADPAPAVTTPAPIRVACVGDSITVGAFSETRSYPIQLQEILGKGWDVKNFGVGGRTMLKKGDYPYWKEQAFKDAQAFQPNYVILMLGANDAKPQNWAHHDEFEANYSEMVEIFKGLASKPTVYICRPTPAPDPGGYAITEPVIQQELPIVDKIAKDENVHLIDMHAALVGHPEMLPDHVHPNADGLGVIAKTVAAVLTAAQPNSIK